MIEFLGSGVHTGSLLILVESGKPIQGIKALPVSIFFIRKIQTFDLALLN